MRRVVPALKAGASYAVVVGCAFGAGYWGNGHTLAESIGNPVVVGLVCGVLRGLSWPMSERVKGSADA